MFMGRIEAETRDGRGSADQVPARSLPVLIGALIAEIIDEANEDQWAGFFQATGGRLAAQLSLERIEDARDLVHEINGLWHTLGWGDVSLEFDDEGVDIFHNNLPRSLGSDDDGGWVKVAPHILVGAYEGWFRSLGSGSHLRTKILRQTADLVQLRHGY